MANKKVNQLISKPAVNLTDLFLIADPTSGQAYKTTISDLGTAIGSGVSSVNSLVGAVVLDTDDIQELVSPTNKWFTDTRARAALSAGTGISYNSGTGVISSSITQYTDALARAAISGGTGISYNSTTGVITNNITQYTDALARGAISLTVSGSSGASTYNSTTGVLNVPTYTLSGLGGVPTTRTLTINGTELDLSANRSWTIDAYTLPTATDSVLGGVKIGSGVTIDSGVISVSTNYQAPLSGTGFVKISGSTISYDNSTYLTTSSASTTYLALTGGTLTGAVTGTRLTLVENSSNIALSIVQTGTGSGLSVLGTSYFSADIQLGSVTADSVLKTNGTGRIAKAVAGTDYVIPSALSSYLPLSGGTLTGALSGTSATFSGQVNAASKYTWGSSTNGTTGQIATDGTNNYFDYIGSLIFRGAAASNTLITFTNAGAATFSSSVTAGGLIKTESYFNAGSGSAKLVGVGSAISGGFSSTDMLVYNTGGDLYLIGTGAAGMIVKGTSGNVGIGTTSPASLVHIEKSTNSGSGSTFPRIRVVNSLATQGDGSSTFNFADINLSAGNDAVQMFLSTTYAAGTWAPAGIINVATNHDLQFKTNNSERMRITSSGNVGIGTSSLSSWGSNVTAIQLPQAVSLYAWNASAVPQLYLGANNYFDGSYFKYTITGQKATLYYQANGEHVWYTAPSGTAGNNIALTQAMTLDSSGRLGIGTTSPNFKLSVVGATDSVIYAVGANNTYKAEMQVEGAGQFTGSLVAIPSGGSAYGGIPTSSIGITTSSTALVFATSNTERMRITSGGQVQIKEAGGTHTSDGLSLINTGSNTWNLVNAGDNFFYFGYNGTSVAMINPNNGSYGALSDKNKKEEIELSNIGLSEIMQLKPSLYRFKDNKDNNSIKELGFIAQEVKDCIPNAYVESGEFIGLNYNPIVAALTKAVQELKAELDTLKNK